MTVALAADVMFVNGVPFLVSTSSGKDLGLVTAEYTPSCMAKQLAAGIRQLMNLFSCRGLQVDTVLMDNEFKKLSTLFPILAVNTTAAKEFEPEDK
jgi:hypothetical protein